MWILGGVVARWDKCPQTEHMDQTLLGHGFFAHQYFKFLASFLSVAIFISQDKIFYGFNFFYIRGFQQKLCEI